MIFLRLFLTFFEIGLFTFGGGYAMISLVMEKGQQWLTEGELLNMIAVSESTPGPIAVNMATFVGSTEGAKLGIPFGDVIGAACATLGVVLPSFIIILIISALIKNFLKYQPVKAFLGGVRPCVVALILATAITLAFSTLFSFESVKVGSFTPDVDGIAIFAVVLVISEAVKKVTGKKPSPIIMILISAGLGMLLYSV